MRLILVDSSVWAEHFRVGDGLLRGAKAIGVEGLLFHAGKAQLAFEGHVVGMDRGDRSLRRET